AAAPRAFPGGGAEPRRGGGDARWPGGGAGAAGRPPRARRAGRLPPGACLARLLLEAARSAPGGTRCVHAGPSAGAPGAGEAVPGEATGGAGTGRRSAARPFDQSMKGEKKHAIPDHHQGQPGLRSRRDAGGPHDRRDGEVPRGAGQGWRAARRLGAQAQLQGMAHSVLRGEAHRRGRTLRRDKGAGRRLHPHPGQVARGSDRVDAPLSQPDQPGWSYRSPPALRAGRLRADRGGAALPRDGPPEPEEGEEMSTKITPFLWFDGKAEEAARFYTSIFENSRITRTLRYGEEGPGPAGSVMVVDFELEGHEFTALNGGPLYQLTPAISFVVH